MGKGQNGGKLAKMVENGKNGQKMAKNAKMADVNNKWPR